MPCSTRSRGNSAPTSFRVASARASGEDSLIARYFKPIATDPGAFSLDDDAAVLKAQGADLVVTTDAIVEGVHFLPGDPAEAIARKALRVNLSDLAAKGAVPAGFVLTLALRAVDDAWLKPFATALGEDAKSYGCPLLGGDTVSTPGPLTVSVTAFGRVPADKMVRRSGAQRGDRVVVTGTIGDGAFAPNSKIRMSSFTDGTSQTLMASEVKAWTPYLRNEAPNSMTTPATPDARPPAFIRKQSP